MNVGRAGALQARYDWLRPVCFYSAYEAATSFVIGQRIAMRQARVIKDRLAAAYGDPVEIGGQVVTPFPRPQRLVDLASVQGLSDTKVVRLREGQPLDKEAYRRDLAKGLHIKL